MTETELLGRIKRYISKHKSLREAARSVGISPGYLSDILSGRRVVTDSERIGSLLTAINVERVVVYRHKKKAPPVG